MIQTTFIVCVRHRKPTKSCWLTLEEMAFASWIMLAGRAVISAALKPSRAKTTKPWFNHWTLQRRTMPCLGSSTVLSLLRASSTQHMGKEHCLCTGLPARVLHLHVLVLHVGIESLQVAELQEVCGKQSECLRTRSLNEAILFIKLSQQIVTQRNTHLPFYIQSYIIIVRPVEKAWMNDTGMSQNREWICRFGMAFGLPLGSEGTHTPSGRCQCPPLHWCHAPTHQ